MLIDTGTLYEIENKHETIQTSTTRSVSNPYCCVYIYRESKCWDVRSGKSVVRIKKKWEKVQKDEQLRMGWEKEGNVHSESLRVIYENVVVRGNSIL